jgi:hypothetical protein
LSNGGEERAVEGDPKQQWTNTAILATLAQIVYESDVNEQRNAPNIYLHSKGKVNTYHD